MNIIGLIIVVGAIVISFNRVQKKFDEMEWEIFQLKEKLKERGIIE